MLTTARCPQCSQPIVVRHRTEVGVAFECPTHGVCGLRFDSMTESQRTMFSQCPSLLDARSKKEGDNVQA